ncbi:MAG TPA: tetratricopeptide repeat protein [Casimicrobiaceae bacterium]|nr:tetratricopeptide repeat protein [Casimicrobiaceae bacterium]
MSRPSRNDPCPCGSGRKYKHCCIALENARSLAEVDASCVRLPDSHADIAAGHAHLARGALVEAIACFQRAIAAGGGSAEVHTHLALALQRSGRMREALASYRDAVRSNPVAANAHFNLAVALQALGETDEALACYRRALTIEPRHAPARVNLANALASIGELDGAIASYREALASRPTDIETRYNLGVALQMARRLDDAIACYREVLARQPDHVAASFNLANAYRDTGRPEEALRWYRKAIDASPRPSRIVADAHLNLGHLLTLAGRANEAVECYRAGVARFRDDARLHNNLGHALEEQGETVVALSSYRRALELNDAPEIRGNFARCVVALGAIEADREMREWLVRALVEPWTRPADLAPACARAIMTHPAYAAWMESLPAATDARTSTIEAVALDAMTALAEDPLVAALLENAQVCDASLEHLLKRTRRALLDAQLGSATHDGAGRLLGLSAALARQCYINEYVFFAADDELERASALRDAVQRALQSDGSAAPAAIAAVAAYFPLHGITRIDVLNRNALSPTLRALLAQQVDEPRAEAALASATRMLTTIDDDLSQRVRQQYEENPYPRWTRLAPVTGPASCDAQLRELFPLVAFEPLAKEAPEILVAGCGTGQETCDLARQWPRARIVAVDLSRASLGYAQRKAREAGLANVEFAQADILRLRSVGRSFDVIASVGVLHHLDDPGAGLGELVSMLRPGGFMRLGFYSELARRHVLAARQFIADHGYTADPAGIRACRQALLQEPAWAAIAKSRDFYTTSECRDLLFHVREHRFDIPGLARMIDGAGLRFVGFLLDPSMRQRYRSRYPDDVAMANLEHWHRFEIDHPDAFTGMYRFWAQRPR